MLLLIRLLCSRAGVDVYGNGRGHRRDPSNGATAYVDDGHVHRCVGTRVLFSRILVLWTLMNGDGVGGVLSCDGRDRGGVAPGLVSRGFPQQGTFRNPPMSLC